VWRMEDVLDLSVSPSDLDQALVCFDECPYQMLDDVRESLAPQPGQPARSDDEDQREGTCSLFLFLEPRIGWRQLEVKPRRTNVDLAHAMRAVVDEHFPDASRLRVVLDHVKTHTLDSLYEACAPEEARRIARRLEVHSTPKHGSWLNMAEIEFAVLARQCLDQRLPSLEQVRQVIHPWQQGRNAHHVQVQWHFTTVDARNKLHRLYPSTS
jgi:hypothetical protein